MRSECCALRGTDRRPTSLRPPARRPQLKRDPLGARDEHRCTTHSTEILGLGRQRLRGVGRMRLAHPMCLILAAAVVLPAHATPLPSPNRVTILYDAFGSRAGLTRDWGFAALVEYNGKRILFDTGNNADVFAKNVRAFGVDLRTVDFVVISHRHGDHTAGLNYLLTVNPGVKIYAPKEGFGVFGAALPGKFYRSDSTLPSRMRYFDGRTPADLTFGPAWPQPEFGCVGRGNEVD